MKEFKKSYTDGNISPSRHVSFSPSILSRDRRKIFQKSHTDGDIEHLSPRTFSFCHYALPEPDTKPTPWYRTRGRGANFVTLGICFVAGITAWLTLFLAKPGATTRFWEGLNGAPLIATGSVELVKQKWEVIWTVSGSVYQYDDNGDKIPTEVDGEPVVPVEPLFGHDADKPASFSMNSLGETTEPFRISKGALNPLYVDGEGNIKTEDGTEDSPEIVYIFDLPINKKDGLKQPALWVLQVISDRKFADVFPTINAEGEWVDLGDFPNAKVQGDGSVVLEFEGRVPMEFIRLHGKDYARVGVFIGTIAGIMLAPLPLGATAFIGLMVGMLLYVLSFKEAFMGFQSLVPWLILVAYFMAVAFIETGLGRRVSLLIMKFLCSSTLMLTWAMSLLDTCMAVGIPSISARAGGVTLPIMSELCRKVGSTPQDGTSEQFGLFAHLVLYHVGVVNASLFYLGVTSNPLAAMAAKEDVVVPVDISFGSWFIAAVVPCSLLIVAIPLIVFFIWRPKMREFPDPRGFAEEGLVQLGPLSRDEIWVIVAFSVAIILWILEGILEIVQGTEGKAAGTGYYLNTVAAGMLGLTILLCTGVLTWQRCLAEAPAWNTMVWFAALISLAASIKPVMVVLSEWLGGYLRSAALGSYFTLVVVTIFYFLSHYFFATTAAHVFAMYAPLVNAMIAAGVPAKHAAFSLAITSALCGCCTPYAIGSSPLYFATGHVPTKTFWIAGFTFLSLNCAVMCGVGIPVITLIFS